jgi:hypothetical protein
MNGLEYHKHYFQLKGKHSEEVINELAFKSFLREWCYTNPRNPDGKEICDLLVCYSDKLIVAQVKDIKFSGNGERYIRKAYEKPLDQVLGAERTLLRAGANIQLTNPHGYTHIFDSSIIKTVFRIVISIGDGEVAFSGLKVVGDKIIHIFDRSVIVIMNELDTIADFCKYLEDKEQLFTAQSQLSLMAGREIDLLGDYIFHGRSFIHLKDLDFVHYIEGIWEKVSTRPEYVAKKAADQASYFWDHLIDIAHECPGNEYRIIAKELSQFNRFERRCASLTFFDAHSRAEMPGLDFRRTWQMNNITFVFVFTPKDRVRSQRAAQLRDVCTVARHKFRENSKVIGIATEIGRDIPHTYDFVLMDFPEWSKENQLLAESLQQKYGILVNPDWRPGTFHEYPGIEGNAEIKDDSYKISINNKLSHKVGRNKPCPCGSGRKYKKCHGAN